MDVRGVAETIMLAIKFSKQNLQMKDRKCSVDLYSLLGIQSVADVLRSGRLRWSGA